MKIPYAAPDTGNTVLARLKLVAAKWKKKQLSLPVFMEIQPDASYEDWKTQLGELSRRFKNQANKPGNREAVDVCIFLESQFKDVEGWGGLLNQLGRLQIEARVEQLAEASSPPELLRQHFNVLAHEVREFVGAPNAERVVEDVFEEKGISVPEPEEATDEEETPPDEDYADDEAEVHSESEEDAQDEPKNVWATLGKLFVNGAVQALKTRAEMTRQQMATDMESLRQTVNVAGTWWSEEGACLSFAQRGIQVQLQGQALNQAVTGQGVVRGRQVELLVWLLSQRTRLRVLLDVAQDGQMMRGTAQDDFGHAIPVALQR